MFTVLRLQPHHAIAYRQLMLNAYALHPEAFTSSASERADLPLDWWQARLSPDEQASEVVFGALEQDQIVGVVGIGFNTRSKARHKTSLFGMYVAGPHQAHGVGRALLETALAYAATRPRTRLVQLTVSENNAAAMRLYTRLGFERFGLEPFAMSLDGQFIAKVHLWRMLPGHELPDQSTHEASA
ncbi:GNAT family N-acetyltransferase [Pseudomonas sp. DWP3-1-2]|uniref:GNAT family N-acetyltransferase n=1 Tax=Pseudomonas sp. DWP3-1-2 TaxID=2804645 RepID=UPI003CF3549D